MQRRRGGFNMSQNNDYFTPARIAELRREVAEQGVAVDPFLADDPDCPVFGLNLACAYPFSAAVGQAYENLASRLMNLDPAAYVYPLWETHVTIVTLVNFNLHRRPAEDEISKVKALAPSIIHCLQPLCAPPFTLRLHPPVLTRKAAIIPISNPTGEIARLRAEALQLVERDSVLHAELSTRGLSAPQIIHSTVMRFKEPPKNLGRFIADFETAKATALLGAIEINEILLTEETKPYMREGKVLHRF